MDKKSPLRTEIGPSRKPEIYNIDRKVTCNFCATSLDNNLEQAPKTEGKVFPAIMDQSNRLYHTEDCFSYQKRLFEGKDEMITGRVVRIRYRT